MWGAVWAGLMFSTQHSNSVLSWPAKSWGLLVECAQAEPLRADTPGTLSRISSSALVLLATFSPGVKPAGRCAAEVQPQGDGQFCCRRSLNQFLSGAAGG